MRGSLHSPEMAGITPEQVFQLGKEWFDAVVEAIPEEEFFSRPKFEHRLVQERQDGRQEEAASMLIKLIRRKFGQTPDWVTAKVTSANLELIEKWSDNFVFANGVDEVFAS